MGSARVSVVDELVERVDGQDRVVGVVTRREAIREGWLHRVAVTVCRDDRGRIEGGHRGYRGQPGLAGLRRRPPQPHVDVVVDDVAGADGLPVGQVHDRIMEELEAHDLA